MRDETTEQDINSRIASRVRALRAERGLSLEGLAASCGVSRSMLSLIERGESSPTAVVLEKIATGLGVSLAALFDAPGPAANPISHREDRVVWRDPESGYLRRNISPTNAPSPIQIVEVILPPGARVAYESGTRDVSIYQQIWVQEGTIEVTLGDTSYQLREDDCFAMQLNAPMAYHNRSEQPARYLVIITSEFSRTRR